MTAKIVKIRRFTSREDKGESLSEGILVKGYGLKDNYIGGGDRQICLFSKEAREWMDVQTVKGLCFQRFNENILIEGLAPSALQVGTIVTIGNTSLTVTSVKPCFDDCVLHASGAYCMLSKCAAFLSVEKGGEIKVGDIVEVSVD